MRLFCNNTQAVKFSRNADRDIMTPSVVCNPDDMAAVRIFNEFRPYVIGYKGLCNAVQSSKRTTGCRAAASRVSY
ncbi:hypothetical protein ES703_72787 [subsurface metagenome]